MGTIKLFKKGQEEIKEKDNSAIIIENKTNKIDSDNFDSENLFKLDSGFAEEYKNKRNKNVTVYRRNNRTVRKVISGSPVHYKDEKTGEYVAINNSLIDSGDEITNGANSYKIKFDKKFKNGKIFELEKDKHVLSLYSEDIRQVGGHGIGCQCRMCAEDNSVTAAVNENVEIQYSVKSNVIKENIIVKSKQDKYEYNFKLNIGKLVATEGNANNILLKDPETDETKFSIPAPYMYDANNVRSFDVNYEIEVAEEMLLIKVVADSKFINADNRAFPVVIDPQIIIEEGQLMRLESITADDDGYHSEHHGFLYVEDYQSGEWTDGFIYLNRTVSILPPEGQLVSIYLILECSGHGYVDINGESFDGSQETIKVDLGSEIPSEVKLSPNTRIESSCDITFSNPKLVLEYAMSSDIEKKYFKVTTSDGKVYDESCLASSVTFADRFGVNRYFDVEVEYLDFLSANELTPRSVKSCVLELRGLTKMLHGTFNIISAATNETFGPFKDYNNAYYIDLKKLYNETGSANFRFQVNNDWGGHESIKYELSSILLSGGPIVSLELNRSPDKLKYVEGEYFSPKGIIVTATCFDGTSYQTGIVNFDQTEPLTLQDNQITIRLGWGELTIYISVGTFNRLEITKLPDNLSYIEGKMFDKTGMVVSAVYSNGERRQITDYSISPNRALLSSDEKITITYNGFTCYQQISVGVLQSIRVNTPPYKKFCIAGETFDSKGMEIVGVYSNGLQKVVTGYTVSPNRALTVNDSYVTIKYNKYTTNLPIMIAVKVNLNNVSIERRIFNDNHWSDWEFVDFLSGNIHLSATSEEQLRAVVSLKKDAIDLGDRKSSGIELVLKKSSESSGAQGHIKVNNVTTSINQDYISAYVGKIREGEDDSLEIIINYCDVDVTFDSEVYVVLCRDIDPATFNTTKQVSLAGDAIANIDMFLGQADIVLSDFASDNTLMRLSIQHIYNFSEEDFGCGKNFRLNLYERLETDAYTENDLVKSHCYTDALGHKHSFNIVFYTMDIDYDKFGPNSSLSDPDIYIKNYLPDISNVTFDSYSGRYIYNDSFVEVEQTTVGDQMYLSEPTATVENLLSSLNLDESSRPVCWLRGDQITKGFNAAGNLVMINDEYGDYIQIIYNDNNLIASVNDNKGNTINFYYNSGKLIYIIDSASKKKVKYSYTSGCLSSISYCTVGNGSIDTVYKTILISYTQIYKNCQLYDAIHQIESSDKFISVLQYEENASADTRLNYVTHFSATNSIPNGNSVITQIHCLKFDYNSEDSVVTLTYDYNDKEIYKFSDNGILMEYYEVTNGLVSKAEKNNYTGYSSYIAVSASNECLNKYTYDNFKFVEGTKTNTTLTLFNKPSSIIIEKIPTGYHTYKTLQKTYKYDERTRCVEEDCTEEYFDEGDMGIDKYSYTSNIIYDAATGVIVKKIIRVWYETDDYRIDKYADVEEYLYDEAGNVTTVKKYRLEPDQPVGGNYNFDSSSTTDIFYTEQSYDDEHRLLNEKDARGLYSTQYGYINGTNLVNSITYPAGGKINFAYNSENKITSMTGTVNGLENGNFNKYTNGEVTEYNHSGDNAIEYTYDFKRRVSQILVGGEVYESYAYEDNVIESGTSVDKITKTNAKGETFTVVADRKGSFFTALYNGGQCLKCLYNARGDITNIQDDLSNTATTVTYNSEGGLEGYLRITGQGRYQEYYEPDPWGRIEWIGYLGLVERQDHFRYSGKPKDNLVQLDTGCYIVNFSYDLFDRYIGKVVKIDTKKIDFEEISYLKENDRLTNLPKILKYSGGNISYDYDAEGNISSIMKDGSLLAKYRYDSLNRLIREDNNALGKSYFYSYDNNGNILSREECNFTIGNHTLGTGTVTTYSYIKDRMMSYNGQACVYDAIGNPTTYRNKTAVWARGRKLTSYNGNTFEYDAQGVRTKKNTISYIYDSRGRLLKQSNGLEFFYDAVGLLGLKYNNNDYYYRKDAQGNIISILDSTGKVVVTYDYDAWGNHKVSGSNTTLGNLNPFRYRSYYYDTETKLYYLQTRYYDPEVGRFINMDSIDYADPESINGLNLYAYCNNNPVMYVDPSGRFILSLFIAAVVAGAIAGAVLGGINGAATAAANGNDIGWGIVIGIISGFCFGAIAGAAGYFMGPLLAGASAIGTLSSGAAFAVGLSIAVVGGFGVGFATDLATQAANNNGGELVLDYKSAALSGAQASFFTVIGAMFGSLATGFTENLGVSFGSGILTGAFNMLVDVIKNYFSKKESSSIKLKVAYGI